MELTDGLLPGADRDLVRPLHKKLSKDFAEILLGVKVVSMVDKGQAIEVTFEGNVDRKVQQFSRVLVSVGRRPNSDGLGLEKTKVQIDKQGFVAVDAQRRTAEPHIWAIGDVAGQPMLAHKATHEGKTAVEAIAGRKVAFEPRAIPAVVFTDPEIAWAGLTETEAKAQGRTVEVAQFPWAASGRAQSVGRTEGLTKWLIDPGQPARLGLRHRRRGRRRVDCRGRAGHRDGGLRGRRHRVDPSPSHAQRNLGLRRRGLLRHRHGSLSSAEELTRVAPTTNARASTEYVPHSLASSQSARKLDRNRPLAIVLSLDFLPNLIPLGPTGP